MVDCSASLINGITDQWGLKWDSVERSTSLYPAAAAQCKAIGGRLPTPTELWRVSANTYGGVGETYQANWLWSSILSQAGDQTVVRMSDGYVSEDSIASTARNYRCVCPLPTNPAFTGTNCFGPPGTSCFTLNMEGGKMNFDAYDRAPVRTGAAILECATEKAHLATYEQLSTAVISGLPNGNSNGLFSSTISNFGKWLHTAEAASYQYDMLLYWTGTNTGFVYGSTEATWSTYQDYRPFRCTGPNIVPTAPATPLNIFTDPDLQFKFDTNDQSPVQYELAIDDCTSRGGHLPSTYEYGKAIYAGLTGSGNQNFSSDNAGYSSHDFLTAEAAWTNAATFNFYNATLGVSWAWKNANEAMSVQHRCIYYPVDPAYAGPPASSCNGSTTCTKITFANRTHMWVDSWDRTAASYSTGVNACLNLGGHLTSERDITEAIRAGLPNGQNALLSTTDQLGTSSSFVISYPEMACVRWTGVNKSFQDEYYYSTPQYEMSNCGYLYDTNNKWPYRCVWTDELR